MGNASGQSWFIQYKHKGHHGTGQQEVLGDYMDAMIVAQDISKRGYRGVVIVKPNGDRESYGR